MKTPKKISKKLNDYMLRKDDLKIAGWLFNFDEGDSVSLGLYNNEIGGPYTPPAKHDINQGAAYIIWADGRISDISINASNLENLDASLKEWRAQSYHDIDAPEILEPLPMPTNLKIKDEKVVDLVMKDSSYFFEILNFYNKELRKKSYTKTVKGVVKAGYGHATVMNSKGLSAEWEETGIITTAEVNDKIGDTYNKRKIPEERDLKKIIEELDRYMSHSQKLVQIKSGKMPLIIVPEVLGEFLGQFLIENLQGSIVANNQSLYSIEDFKTKKQVFDERINLVIDGLKEYLPATQPCSGEGVPSTKQHIITDGRLITPILDLKYAKKVGMSPTSTGTLGMEIREKILYDEMIKGMDYGLIVYGVLGMHTQTSKEGDYSLTIGEGLLVKNGKIKGAIKDITIAGNFFDALRDKKTKFADYREDELAIRIEEATAKK